MVAKNFADDTLFNMNVFIFIITLFLYSTMVHANNCSSWPSIDHSLFLSKTVKKQHDISSCHAFTTLSLIEFNYSKLYGKSINLSEHDLLLSHFIWDAQKDEALTFLTTMLKINLQMHKVTPNFTPAYAIMGGVEDDLWAVKKFGVATEEQVPYRFQTGQESFMSLIKLAQIGISVYRELKPCAESSDINKILTAKLQKDVLKILAKMNINKDFKRNTSPEVKETRLSFQNFSRTLNYSNLHPLDFKNLINTLREVPVGAKIRDYSGLRNNGNIKENDLHSVVISGYNCKTEEFVIRNSGNGKIEKIHRDVLFKGLIGIDIIK